MHPVVESAVLALGLDAATAELVNALDRRALTCVILKGPVVAHWLYADDPSRRTYRDVDVAVDPGVFEDAESVLAELGYRCLTGEMLPREKAWLMESAW